MNAPLSTEEKAARRGRIESLISRLGLRFPGLFLLLSVILVVDLFVPDFIPFVDEIVLALLTTLFGLWRKKKEETSPAPPLPGDVEGKRID
ncbi:MAG: hypothetical protein IT186_19825 [Acidobacteria bacterium]|nr:hypothetical protein [Acidobacteriota bacterium]MCG3192768.1 hypothetical protein [Thermoanaerobaculia bacterium]MCK6684668.1 hypothetical protein [Thermoanaerobaculia bacterium]